MKPFPNELDYGDVVDSVDTRMVTFNAMQSVAYERARADWYESEVVPLLREIEPYLDSVICYASTITEHPPNAFQARVKAVLAELEGK